MGQKGKFLSQRAGYSIFWQDFWYLSKNYHSAYYQNILIRNFVTFLFSAGLSTSKIYMTALKKKTNLIEYKFLGPSTYLSKFKTDFNSVIWGREFLRPLKGFYLTKLHIVKLFNYITVSGAGYRWTRKKFRVNSFFKSEHRLDLFYSSILLLEQFNSQNYIIAK